MYATHESRESSSVGHSFTSPNGDTLLLLLVLCLLLDWLICLHSFNSLCALDMCVGVD